MPMLLTYLRRTPALAASLIIALAASACASKNPLIDKEPASATSAKNEAAPDKPVLPKPALVVQPPEAVKPAGEAKPSTAVPPAGAKPSPVPTATEAKPVVSAPALVAPAPQSQIALIGDQNKSAPTGAQRWLGIFKPYKTNVQQGNFVSNDMAAKLRPGMTKEQVRFVLGTPLLTDLFHADRWDYLFRLQKPNGELTTNRVAVFFRDNQVERIQSSNLPSESEYLSHIAGPVEGAKPETAPSKPSSPAAQPST